MTYFDKLLEEMGGNAKDAALLTYMLCPKNFFDGAPSCCDKDEDEDVNLILACRMCWFSEVEE